MLCPPKGVGIGRGRGGPGRHPRRPPRLREDRCRSSAAPSRTSDPCGEPRPPGTTTCPPRESPPNATRPPGRHAARAVVIAASVPAITKTTSTPRPPVASHRFGAELRRPRLNGRPTEDRLPTSATRVRPDAGPARSALPADPRGRGSSQDARLRGGAAHQSRRQGRRAVKRVESPPHQAVSKPWSGSLRPASVV